MRCLTVGFAVVALLQTARADVVEELANMLANHPKADANGDGLSKTAAPVDDSLLSFAGALSFIGAGSGAALTSATFSGTGAGSGAALTSATFSGTGAGSGVMFAGSAFSCVGAGLGVAAAGVASGAAAGL